VYNLLLNLGEHSSRTIQFFFVPDFIEPFFGGDALRYPAYLEKQSLIKLLGQYNGLTE